MIFKIGNEFNLNFKISEDIYQGFINLFKDKNPIHTDSNFSSKYGYINKVMHGNILNGFISYFVGEKLPSKKVVIIYQDISFNNPFYLNDKLNFNAVVSELYESVNIVCIKYYFKDKSQTLIAKGEIKLKILK